MRTARLILALLVLLGSSASFGQIASSAAHHQGALHRAWHARAEFQRTHPCPTTGKTSGSCPGFVIDYIIPLGCGGHDKPSNMEWQNVKDAKAKDRVERKNCEDYRGARGDPTVVPEKLFGSITVSCGARKAAQQELKDAQPRIEGEGKPSPAIREGR